MMHPRMTMAFGSLFGVLVIGVTAASTAPMHPRFSPGWPEQNSEYIVRVADRQENIFLKLGSVKGTATTSKFKDQVVALSTAFTIHQDGEWDEGDRKSGRVARFGDLAIIKYMDTASPSLAQACAMKEQFPKADIAYTTGDGETFYKLGLENVIVTNVSVTIHSGEARPVETVTLRYRKATWEWGTAKGGFDLAQNTKV